MRYSTQVRSISFLKANAAEVMRQLDQQREPMVITQNGTAEAVIQDVASYDTTQETLALLKILALGNHQVEQGKVEPLARVVERFDDLVFDTVITRTVRFPETSVAGEPITTWAPKSLGAQAYRSLAHEVIDRFGK